ncbi:MAG: response regulator [Acidobacteriia bacterium]|nr:response regulator [Terriglobia bacterium]
MENKKIIIVDDEPGVREAVATVLSREGYEVLEAGDGTSGVSLALRERPALVILDVLMEPMSGWEVCRILRQIKEIADTPVLMLTGKQDVKDKITAMQVGADDFLPKPFRNDELKWRVERLACGAILTS